jgi:hypothetical protein
MLDNSPFQEDIFPSWKGIAPNLNYTFYRLSLDELG